MGPPRCWGERPQELALARWGAGAGRQAAPSQPLTASLSMCFPLSESPPRSKEEVLDCKHQTYPVWAAASELKRPKGSSLPPHTLPRSHPALSLHRELRPHNKLPGTRGLEIHPRPGPTRPPDAPRPAESSQMGRFGQGGQGVNANSCPGE